MHGVLMVWFFLIPSIPSVLGNFVIPLMIGARDVAFPKLNLLSWYLFMIGGFFVMHAIIIGGVDTGWTFYTPYSTRLLKHARHRNGGGNFHRGLRFNFDRTEFHHHHPKNARARA